MKAACSFDRLGAMALLQAAHGSHHIGTFENGNQLVERPLIVLRTRLQIFFQYELGFPNCLNGQLLVGHTHHSLIGPRKHESQIKAAFGFLPAFL
jgi:hypothetical protein